MLVARLRAPKRADFARGDDARKVRREPGGLEEGAPVVDVPTVPVGQRPVQRPAGDAKKPRAAVAHGREGLSEGPTLRRRVQRANLQEPFVAGAEPAHVHPVQAAAPVGLGPLSREAQVVEDEAVERPGLERERRAPLDLDARALGADLVLVRASEAQDDEEVHQVPAR